ncbi:MAG: hypothetical protein ABL957_15910 [Parvularculaceae bacterium]
MTENGDASKNWVCRDNHFSLMLGLFNSGWATLELTTDFAIYKFLGVTPLQAHLITGGLVFGRRAKLLADLVGRSDHPKKKEILATFQAVRSNNKRDVFAHSYIWSNSRIVRFIERPAGGNEATAKAHDFTLAEFEKHVSDFADKCVAFYSALGCTYEEVQAFGDAALSLDRKAKRSPGNPTSNS